MKQRLSAFLALIALAAPATAIDTPSVERGKELFTSKQLGTNGTSCATCHQNGKGLEGVGEYNDDQLEKIVNRCITKALNGKALNPASNDLKSLVMYTKTLGYPHQ